MADFIFRVSSVKLTGDQQKKIASAIQGAVLTELAALDLGAPPPAPDCLFRPITWAGGIMIAAAEAAAAAGTTLSVSTRTAT